MKEVEMVSTFRLRYRLSVISVLALVIVSVLSVGIGSVAADSTARRPGPPTGTDGTKVVYEWSYNASAQSVPAITTQQEASVLLTDIQPQPVVPEGDRWVVEAVSVSAHASFTVGTGASMVYFGLENTNGARLFVPLVVTQQTETGINWVGTIATHLYIDNPTLGDMPTRLVYGLFGGLSGNQYFTVSLFGYLVPLGS